MGFFSEIISATVKTALTPIAIVKDVANVALGNEADETKKLLESAGEDMGNAVDHLTGEK
jgi:hypothetical protein